MKRNNFDTSHIPALPRERFTLRYWCI